MIRLLLLSFAMKYFGTFPSFPWEGKPAHCKALAGAVVHAMSCILRGAWGLVRWGDGMSYLFSSLPSPSFTLLKSLVGTGGTLMPVEGTSLSPVFS